MLDRLAETDARIEQDLLLAHAAREREGQAFLQELEDLHDDIVVARFLLHGLGLPLHVHQADGAACLGDHVRHVVVAAQGGDVIDDRRAGGQGAARHLRLDRVDADRHADAPASASTTGSTRRSSSSGGTGSEPGRVDSPPMSTMAAPSRTSVRACSSAASAARKRPPSENESGVTLTTPMMAGNGRSSEKVGAAGGMRARQRAR